MSGQREGGRKKSTREGRQEEISRSDGGDVAEVQDDNSCSLVGGRRQDVRQGWGLGFGRWRVSQAVVERQVRI